MSFVPKDKSKKRKIAIIAGSRGEYGYFQPIVREIEKRENLDYGFVLANMHMLDRFGSSAEEIQKDNLKIEASIFNTFDGYNHLTMVKSLSVFMLQLPEILHNMGADMVLLGGDRGEQLVGAIVGAHLYLPVAHIQAGELSGNIDGVSRHAITKFSHIHFASNQDAADRVLKMGEESHRIYNVGAPQLDDFTAGLITPQEEIYRKFNLNKDKPVILVLQHSITEQFDQAEKQMEETMKAIKNFDAQILIILNNSDAGSNFLRRVVNKNRNSSTQTFSNVPRRDYGGLLNVASVLVGNSSSGILEAPSFKLPSVNIGDRQYGRLQGINVINVQHEAEEIIKAIKFAMSEEFKEKIKDCANPYGNGQSSKKIVDILENIEIDDKLLIKRLTY